MTLRDKQILNRNTDDDWRVCQDFFEDYVTERDLRIEATSIEDWKKLFSLVKQHPEWTAGEVGSAGAFGEVTSSIFPNDGAIRGSYLIHLEHEVVVYLWPTQISFIEMDVEAHRIYNSKTFSALLGFMSMLGTTLEKNMQLTQRYEPKAGMIEYISETKQFLFYPPSF